MQHDRVWSLHTTYLKLGSITKKKILYLTSDMDVSGNPQKGKKLMVENQEYRGAVPDVKS